MTCYFPLLSLKYGQFAQEHVPLNNVEQIMAV